MTPVELVKIADQGYDSLVPFWDEVFGEFLDDEVCGDKLALFIVQELRDTFEPSASREDQLENAISYMETAKTDIESVITALQVAMQDQGISKEPEMNRGNNAASGREGV